jgi:hypothetical protein
MNFKLDRGGGAEVLKKLVADEIRALGNQIGAQAGDEAEVVHYVTDRAAASVRVPAAQQAKHGTLTKAASAAGLEVKAK